ncbi:MAG: hypothetical protein HZA46_06175 [Planctomycetales bacterium]|nr:hypothetical protein [Planctomycetales bacterium]
MKTIYLTIGLVVAMLVGPAASDEPAPKPTPLSRELQSLFDAGAARGANVLPDVQRRHAAARKAVGDDSRLDYAYGLILLKHLKHKEAVAQFQTATQRKGDTYWPAWQALVWGHFAAKDYPAGCDRMGEMARKLAAIADEDDSPEVRRSIEWLGQMVAALGKVADSPKQKDAVAKIDRQLQEVFAGDELVLYESGKKETDAVASDTVRELEQTQQKVQAKDEQDRKKKLTQVESNLETSQEKRESLKKTAEDAKATLDEQLASFDKQLARLEKDYDFLEKRGQSLLQSQLQLQQQLTLLSLPQPGAGNNAGGQGIVTVQQQLQRQQISNLQAQQVAYQIEYDRTALSALGVSQQAARVVQDRATAVNRYEKTTGQLLKQDATLGKWEDRMKKSGDKLKKAAKDKPAGGTPKVNLPKSLRSYVDLNFTIERDRVLESAGVELEKPVGE